jgi:hypothetical protein
MKNIIPLLLISLAVPLHAADSEDGKILQLTLKPNSDKHLLLKAPKP